MDQQKVPTASPGRNEKGSTLSIRIPVEMWEFLDRARRQFSYPGAETLSISDVARCLVTIRVSGGRIYRVDGSALQRWIVKRGANGKEPEAIYSATGAGVGSLHFR